MSKTKNTTNDRMCTCSKCGIKLRSIPDTQHRRCNGSPPQAGVTIVRPKHNKIPSAERGIWT